MEFKFNINDYFKQQIVEINHNLIPPGFSGDRRALWDTIGKVTEVVNAMGEASAAAQGLTKAITTAERLRNSEHKLYLLIDESHNDGKGAVTGMLKVGRKTLYLFDRDGQHYQATPLCILDFYVHESRQRSGLGKILYEHLLNEEQIDPVKIAIDRPSDKFLGFLRKHYNLESPIKQMNNYVVFDGFFPEEDIKSEKRVSLVQSSSPNVSQNSPAYGRYGAPRPKCSMGQIIHNQTSTVPTSSTPVGSIKANEEKPRESPKLERPHSLSIPSAEEIPEEVANGIDVTVVDGVEKEETTLPQVNDIQEKLNDIEIVEEAFKTKTPSHLTEQGFFDLKFYHNKLW